MRCGSTILRSQWTTLLFDITGSCELARLTCLTTTLPFVSETLTLAVKHKPYSGEMVFVCRDREAREEWARYLEAAIRTADEMQANPGVRMLRADPAHARSASSISLSQLSPSPVPNSGASSPPPLRQDMQDHLLDKLSHIDNY